MQVRITTNYLNGRGQGRTCIKMRLELFFQLFGVIMAFAMVNKRNYEHFNRIILLLIGKPRRKHRRLMLDDYMGKYGLTNGEHFKRGAMVKFAYS